MIDAQELSTDLDAEEQASVLLDVVAACLGEALAQGAAIDLATLEGLSVDSTPEGDMKLVLRVAGADPVEVLVPASVALESLGEVGSEEAPAEESAEGEPAST